MPQQSDALRRLQELREKRSQQEDAELQQKREQLNKSLKIKKSLLPQKFGRRHYILGGGLVGLVLLLYVGISTPYRLIAPGYKLEAYEEALAAQNYDEAITAIREYLELRPDDVENQVAYGELLLIVGNNGEANKVLLKAVSDSLLSEDAEVKYLAAVAALPDINEAAKRNNLTLASLNSYQPSLLLRALLSGAENPEQAVQDLSVAERQLPSLANAQQRYQRHRELLTLTLVTICREIPEQLNHVVTPKADAFPANLTVRQQLIAGVDNGLQANFCAFVPTAPNEYASFAPKLESIVYATSIYAAIVRGELDEARVAVGQAFQEESQVINIFFDGLLLAQVGDFDKAISTWLRVGRSNAAVFRNNISIAEILSGPDSWEAAKKNLDVAIRQGAEKQQALNNRAVLSIIEGRLGQASADLQQALEQMPGYLFATYNQGIISLLEQDYEQSVATLNSVFEHAEQLSGLHYYLAQAYDGQGVAERALASYRLAVDSPMFASLANLAIGDYFGRSQISYEVALGHYRDASSLDPSNYQAVLKQAAITAKLGDVNEALDLLDDSQQRFENLTAEELGEYNSLFALIKGQILFDSGRTGSEELLKDAFENSASEELRQQVAVLYTDVLLDRGLVREALDVTRIILPSDPNDVELLVARAKALIAIQDLGQAQNIVDSAEALEPDNYNVKLAKASLFALDQRWQESLDLYKQTFLLNPASTQPLDLAIALLDRATVPDEEKQLAELTAMRTLADKNFEELTQPVQKPDTKLVAFKQAATEEEIAQIQEQIDKLSELLETEQAEPYGALVTRGIFYSRIGDTNRAISDMIAATQVAGRPENDYEAWVNLSQIYTSNGQFLEADQALTEALQRNPPNPIQLLFARAAVREEFDPTLAIEDYDRLIEELPSSHDAYMRRGLSKIALGDSQSAIEDFTQVIRINPRNINAYQARMSAFIVIGDRQAASKDAETIGVLSNQ